MRNRKKLPIGIDSFEKIIRHNFYYVDKTEMITELLHNWGEVNLFTRPRRFGKSLNMNMLQSFLEIGCDKSLFNGLKVSREKELCEEYMGKFPVISLTLKNVEGLNFESARKSLKNTLGMEAWRLSALAESSRLTEEEKNSYKALTVVDDHGDFKMSDATMEKALLILTVLLEKHYGKKAVLLIDEYDVPLDKAFQYGYYDEMVSLIRNMFGNVLKTNSSLFQRHFRTFCHDQMYLYYFFILLQLFQQFYCKGRSGSPTHTDDKSLSHFSSFPDFSVHIKVCLKNFPTICTNYTRSFPISFAILLFTWIIPTKNT